MAANSPGQQLNDLLVTRNFDPEALDARTGKPPLDAQGAPDSEAADMFTFDWVANSGKNYGTVVCLLGADNNFEVYFGDNLGRGMEFDDKNDWYEFLAQLRNFAKRNLLRYDLQNLRRLKYTMAGMAAIKEGLFEGYYGNRKVSYAGKPTEARLMIKHDRTLGENDARFRYVESLFIETVAGERFRLPFRKLAGGRAMLEHVRHGGTPYDARGQHIVEMVEQINVLSQFRRAHQGRVFEGAAGELVAETIQYLDRLRHNLKAVSHDRGYTQYFESWSPATVSESDLIVEDLKSLFVETRIDPRIEQALPMLARIQKEAQAMKEAEIFESWANRIVEGTWALPETPEQQDELKMLMSQPLIAGADGMNATEQLYGLVGDDELFDIIGDIAVDPDANCWDDPRVQNRLEELGVYMVSPAEPAAATATPPVAENGPYDLPGIDYLRPGEGPRRPPASDEHNPYPYSKEEDDDYFREIFRKNKAKQQGMAEGDNLATFEEAECNHTEAGEYCPEHGLEECGTYEDAEQQKSDDKAFKPNIPGALMGAGTGALIGGPVGMAAGATLGALAEDNELLSRIISLALGEEDDPGEKLAGAGAGGFVGSMGGLAAGGLPGALAGGIVGATLGNKMATNANNAGTPDETPPFVRETNSPITNIAKDIGATAADVANAPADAIYSAGQLLYHDSDANPGQARGDEDNEIVRNARKLNDGWKGTLAGSAAGGIAGDMAGQALGPAAGAALGGAVGGVPGAIAGGAMGALAGGPIGGAIGGLAGGKIGDKLGGPEETDEDSSTGAVVKGAMKAATQGLGDLVSGSGKEVAKNLIHMESNSDSALLARIKSLALLK